MLSRIILLLLLFAGIAVAADYTVVVTKDDHVQILDSVLNGLNYFFGDDGFDTDSSAVRYRSFTGFIVVLGTIWILIQLATYAIAGNARAGFQNYVIYLMLLFLVSTLIWGPRSTVLIQTKNNSSYLTADKVPFLIAFTMSSFANLRYELTDMSTGAFNIPDPTDNFSSGGSGGLGFMGSQTALSELPTLANFNVQTTDKALAEKYGRYVRDCVILPKVASGEGVDSITYSNNLKVDLAPANLGTGSEFVSYRGNTGTCAEFWDSSTTAFGAGFTPLYNSIINLENDVNQTKKIGSIASSLAYMGAMIDNQNSISAAASVKAATTQSILSNEYRSVYAKMGVAGQVASDGAAQSMYDIQLSGLQTGIFVTEQLPRVGFLLFALMVAATPFLFAFALFPGSLKILVNFFKTLLWIALWEPMASILGLFQDIHMANVLKENGYTTVNNVLSLAPQELIQVSSEAASIAGIAGGLYIAVQGLSWLLITGSGQMLGNIVGGIASNFQQRASADNQLATRGDLQESYMMSASQGRDVGLTEKYAFSTNMNASKNASQLTGAMNTYGGSGPSSVINMSTSDSINSTMQSSSTLANSLASREVYGDGRGGIDTTSVVNAQSINASKGMSSELHTANTFGNMKTAINQGKLESTRQAQSAMSQYEGQTVESMKKLADTEGKAARGKDDAIVKTFNNSADAYKANYNSTLLQTKTMLAEAGYLSKMTDSQIDAVAQLQGSGVEVSKDMLEKISKQSGKDLQQTVQQTINTKSTTTAGDHVKSTANVKAQGDSSGFLDNQNTMGTIAGLDEDAVSDVHESYSPKQQQDLSEYKAQEQVNAKYKEQQLLEGTQNDYKKTKEEAQQQSTELKAQKAELDASIKDRSMNAAEKIKQLTSNEAKKAQTIKDAKNELTQKKAEFAQRRQEAIKQVKFDEDGDKFNETLNAINNDEKQAEQAYEQTVKDNAPTPIAQLASDFYKGLQADTLKSQQMGAQIQQLEQTAIEAQNREESLAVSNMGNLEAKQKAEKLSQSALASIQAFINKGDMSGAEMEQLKKSLMDAGISGEDAGRFVGIMKGTEIAGQMRSADLSAKEIVDIFDSKGGTGAFVDLGISQETIDRVRAGKGSDTDKAMIYNAAKGLSNMKISTSVNGINVTTTIDDRGKSGASNVDSSSNITMGYNINNNTSGSFSAAGADSYTTMSKTEAAVRGGVQNVLTTATSFVGGKGMGKIADAASKRVTGGNGGSGAVGVGN